MKEPVPQIILGLNGIAMLVMGVTILISATGIEPTPSHTLNGSSELAARSTRNFGFVIVGVYALGAYGCYKGVVALNR